MRRVLLKLSGAVLGGEEGGLSRKVLEEVSQSISQAAAQGVQVAVVLGGGNILRGAQANEIGVDRVTGDYMGMLATLINALALQSHLERRGAVVRVMSAIAAHQVAEPYIRRRAIRHLEKGRVVLLAGGTGNPFFSTDTAAVLRAAEIEAQEVLKATSVDGVYTADPKRNADAELLPQLTYNDFLRRELGVMDATAVQLAKERGLPIVVFNVTKPGNLLRALLGERVGSVIKEV